MQDDVMSLWDCLHDGLLKGVTCDLLARSATLVVDVPYLWEHHDLPANTRFHIILEGCKSCEVLEHQAWPGATEPPTGLPWREAQDLRQQAYLRGCFKSRDWTAFLTDLEAGQGYDISNADLTTADDKVQLSLDIWHNQPDDYVQLRFEGEHARFSVSTKGDLTADEFLNMGKSYWEAFADRASSLAP